MAHLPFLTLTSSAAPTPFSISSIGKVTPLLMTNGSPPLNYLLLQTLFPLITYSTLLPLALLLPHPPPTLTLSSYHHHPYCTNMSSPTPSDLELQHIIDFKNACSQICTNPDDPE